MSTGPSSNSAEAPSEPEPPFTGGRRHAWLAIPGRHPVTWAIVAVILLGSTGAALLQQRPGGSAHTQSIYCGLVKCAVVRSVADSSTTAAGAPSQSPAPPSSAVPSSAPAPTPTPTRPAPAPARSRPPKPVAASEPAPAPSPKPTAPAPKPSPTWAPGPRHWPWPPAWPWPWGWGGGGRHFGPSSGHWQFGGHQQRRLGGHQQRRRW